MRTRIGGPVLPSAQPQNRALAASGMKPTPGPRQNRLGRLIHVQRRDPMDNDSTALTNWKRLPEADRAGNGNLPADYSDDDRVPHSSRISTKETRQSTHAWAVFGIDRPHGQGRPWKAQEAKTHG